MMNDNNNRSSSEQVGCCTYFWGPFRPLFGRHTLAEAATSAILPTPVVLIYRAAFTIFLGSVFLYHVIGDPSRLIFFTVWSHLALSLTFAFMTALTLLYFFVSSQTRIATNPLASLAIIAFQIFASAALFLDVVYWAFLYKPGNLDFYSVTAHAINLALVLIELFASVRMQFKLIYIPLSVLYVAIYLAFMLIRYAVVNEFTYDIYDFRTKSAGQIALYFGGSFVWCVVAAFIIFIVSRVNRLPCVPQFNTEGRESSDKDDDDMNRRPFDSV